MDINEDLPGSRTSYDIMRSSVLLPGITYYSNVLAYGFSDIHHTESSDGFKPDKYKPTEGIVFDGIGKEKYKWSLKENPWSIFVITVVKCWLKLNDSIIYLLLRFA